MNWNATPPRIEIAATSIASACLGGAVVFAVARIGPLGAGLIEASVAGAFVALAGWVMIGRVDRRRGARQLFGSVDLPDANLDTEDALLLDQPVGDEALLLDDPLPVVGEDSRVVRLFAAHPLGAEPARPLTGPGEMIARIEDFLGQTHGSEATAERADGAGRAGAEDASVALHAALADIRRSLRQA